MCVYVCVCVAGCCWVLLVVCNMHGLGRKPARQPPPWANSVDKAYLVNQHAMDATEIATRIKEIVSRQGGKQREQQSVDPKRPRYTSQRVHVATDGQRALRGGAAFARPGTTLAPIGRNAIERYVPIQAGKDHKVGVLPRNRRERMEGARERARGKVTRT